MRDTSSFGSSFFCRLVRQHLALSLPVLPLSLPLIVSHGLCRLDACFRFLAKSLDIHATTTPAHPRAQLAHPSPPTQPLIQFSTPTHPPTQVPHVPCGAHPGYPERQRVYPVLSVHSADTPTHPLSVHPPTPTCTDPPHQPIRHSTLTPTHPHTDPPRPLGSALGPPKATASPPYPPRTRHRARDLTALPRRVVGAAVAPFPWQQDREGASHRIPMLAVLAVLAASSSRTGRGSFWMRLRRPVRARELSSFTEVQ